MDQHVEHLHCLSVLEALGRGKKTQHTQKGAFTGTTMGNHAMPTVSEEEDTIRKADKSSGVPHLRRAQTVPMEAAQKAGTNRRGQIPLSRANDVSGDLSFEGGVSGEFEKDERGGMPVSGYGSSNLLNNTDGLFNGFFGQEGNSDLLSKTQAGRKQTREPKLFDLWAILCDVVRSRSEYDRL